MSNILNLEKNIIRIKECDSTNTFAKELISKSEPTGGIVVITDKQTNGKGQFGNKWLSEDNKNLTFSIVVKPVFLNPTKQFYLSKITAIACIQTLVEISDTSFKIKWPNDIYHKNKKIGGILIENSITSKNIIDSIIGIGININQRNFEEKLNATSLNKINNEKYDIENIFIKLLENFQKLYFKIQTNNFAEINNLYKTLLLGINTEIKFKNIATNKTFSGFIKGVNEIGQLHLIVLNKNCYFNLKELVWQL